MHNSSRVGPAIVSREEQQAFIPIYKALVRCVVHDPAASSVPCPIARGALARSSIVRHPTIRRSS
jgi:hypothetical protein